MNGVVIELKVIPFKAGLLLKGGNCPVALFWESYQLLVVHPSQRWMSLGELVDEAKATANAQRREGLYERYNRLLADPETPYVFLVEPSNVIAARDDIADVRYHSLYSLEIDSLRRQ